MGLPTARHADWESLEPYTGELNALQELITFSGTARAKAAYYAARKVVSDFCPRMTPETVPWHQLTRLHLHEMYTYWSSQHAETTAHQYLKMTKALMREAVSLGLLGQLEYNVATTIRTNKIPRRLVGRALTADEARLFFAACVVAPPEFPAYQPVEAAKVPVGVRDALLFATLYYGGTRISETLNITMADITWQPELRIHVRRAKAGANYVLYPNKEYVAHLDAWLAIRGGEDGFLITSRRPNKTWRTDKAMSTWTARKILRKRCEIAGIDPITSHDLRRSKITRLLAKQIRVGDIQTLVGHNSARSTMLYDRGSEDRARQISQEDLLDPDPELAF